MLISIRDLRELPMGQIWVLRPKQSQEELSEGHMKDVENHYYQQDDLIVHLEVNSDSFIVLVHFLIKRIGWIDHESPFRETSDFHQPSLMILYDSPPSSLVMSASEVAVYKVLKPVYTAIASVAVYPATGTSKTM
jgi:hypothetical protein